MINTASFGNINRRSLIGHAYWNGSPDNARLHRRNYPIVAMDDRHEQG